MVRNEGFGKYKFSFVMEKFQDINLVFYLKGEYCGKCAGFNRYFSLKGCWLSRSLFKSNFKPRYGRKEINSFKNLVNSLPYWTKF